MKEQPEGSIQSFGFSKKKVDKINPPRSPIPIQKMTKTEAESEQIGRLVCVCVWRGGGGMSGQDGIATKRPKLET
jgi:hypothetical protein